VPPKKKPKPHPEPPPDLQSRPLPLRSFRTAWFRIHDSTYGPLYFGRTGDHRFDAPHPRKYGVLYVAAEIECAFLETLGHETGKTVLAEADSRAELQPSVLHLKTNDIDEGWLSEIERRHNLFPDMDYRLYA
jgi:hypothetical protein